MENDKSIELYTLHEFREMEPHDRMKPFTGLVIVPMNEVHASGYRCMKFILEMNHKIVGVVGGWQDVVKVNGTLGAGLNFTKSLETGMVKRIGWQIDCLPRSGCIRLWQREYILRCGEFESSEFSFYVTDIMQK